MDIHEQLKSGLKDDWKESTESDGLSKELRDEIADWWIEKIVQILWQQNNKGGDY